MAGLAQTVFDVSSCIAHTWACEKSKRLWSFRSSSRACRDAHFHVSDHDADLGVASGPWGRSGAASFGAQTRIRTTRATAGYFHQYSFPAPRARPAHGGSAPASSAHIPIGPLPITPAPPCAPRGDTPRCAYAILGRLKSALMC